MHLAIDDIATVWRPVGNEFVIVRSEQDGFLAGPAGGLLEEIVIAFLIRRPNDTIAIGRPNREVVVRWGEREPRWIFAICIRQPQVVITSLAVTTGNHKLLSIRRQRWPRYIRQIIKGLDLLARAIQPN